MDQCLQSDLSFSLLDPGRRCGRGEVRFLTIIIFTNPIIIMIMISIIDKNFFKLFKEEEEAQYMEEQVAEVTTEGTGFVDHHHCHHQAVEKSPCIIHVIIPMSSLASEC